MTSRSVHFVVEDHDRLEAVAGGPPLVLLHVPRRHRRQRLAARPAARRGRRPGTGRSATSAARSSNEETPSQTRFSRVPRCGAGPQVPADLRQHLDHAGRELVVGVRLELLPGLEVERQPGGRQLLEHQRPVRRVAGVHPGPDRRGRRQRLQVRVVAQHRGQHRHHPRPVRHADVHVHAPDQHLPAPPLGAVDQLLVAMPLGQLLLRSTTRTGACRRRTGPRPSSSPAGTTTASVSRRSVIASSTVVADAGHHLDGVAQQLLVQPARVGQPGLGPARTGARRRCAGRGYAGRRARTPTPRRASARARRRSRCAPRQCGAPNADRRVAAWGRGPGFASIGAVPETRELNLTLDFCLRVGELLLSSGAGAADVAATMLSLARSLGASPGRGRRDLHGARR